MIDSEDFDIHPSHILDPEDAPQVYQGGIACRRCGFFVAFVQPRYRITAKGVAPCSAIQVSLRTSL